MNHDERETAPADYYGTEPGIECICGCGREVNPNDPCMIDGKLFSDHCASNLTALRLEGWIKPVQSRTEKVRDEYNRAMDAALYEMIYPIRTVKHI